MTPIQIAQIVHEANRAYCQTLGDSSQVAWSDAPEWQKDSAVNGVEGILNGTITKPEQSHESWLAEKARTGWKYGAVKNAETKEHPCFVPYAELAAGSAGEGRDLLCHRASVRRTGRSDCGVDFQRANVSAPIRRSAVIG